MQILAWRFLPVRIVTPMPISTRIPGAAAASSTRQRGGNPRELVAVTVITVVANLSVGLAPSIVNALSAHAGIGSAQAGLCVSAEMLGFVVGAAALLLLPFESHRRVVALIALLLLASGNLLCLPASTFSAYITARLIAGIGCGLTTFTYALVATTLRPVRNFAMMSAATVAATAVFAELAPWLALQLGADSLFALIALSAVLSMLGAWWIAGDSVQSRESESIAVTRAVSPVTRPRSRLAVAIGIAMMLLYFTPLSAYWAFVAQVGMAREANPTSVAAVVSSGLLVAGVAGSLMGTLSLLQDKHRYIVGFATLGGAASIVVGCLIHNFAVYATAVSAFILLWYLAMPFLMGILSAVDSSGRLAIGGILIETVGFVVGPAIGGPFVERQAYLPLAVVCATMFVASLGCALVVAPRSTNRSGTRRSHESREVT